MLFVESGLALSQERISRPSAMRSLEGGSFELIAWPYFDCMALSPEGGRDPEDWNLDAPLLVYYS